MERGVVERRIKGRGKVFCLTHFLKKQDNIIWGKGSKAGNQISESVKIIAMSGKGAEHIHTGIFGILFSHG